MLEVIMTFERDLEKDTVGKVLLCYYHPAGLKLQGSVNVQVRWIAGNLKRSHASANA